MAYLLSVKATKRLAKHELAHDITGHECPPPSHISDAIPILGFASHTLDSFGNLAPNHVFPFSSQACSREAAREHLPRLSMLVWIKFLKETGRTIILLSRANEAVPC